MRVLLGLLVLGAALAGCADQGDTSDQTIDTDPVERLLPTGELAHGHIAGYVMDHPYRTTLRGFEPFMQTARDDLAGLLEAMDLDVVRHEAGQYVNVLGIKNGTSHPEQWVVISAHYDTVGAGVGTTVYGAWDDGAGVGALLALAETVGTWELPFTVVFAFFDGEESGLQGSQAFVETYFDDGRHDLVANINMDPPGLNWPCGDQTGLFPVKIIHQMDQVDAGAPRYVALYDALEVGLNATGVPMENRDYTPGIPIATVNGGGVSGTSDHANFGAVGIANVFLGGTPTTVVGPAAALTYPLHTPLDTLQAMEARCQVGTLADGLHTIVETVAGTLLALEAAGVAA